MFSEIRRLFRQLSPAVDYCSVRYLEQESESLRVRRDVTDPFSRQLDRGLMLSVIDGGGCGYAATADCSAGGVRAAFERACEWARVSRTRSVFDYSRLPQPRFAGSYHGAQGPEVSRLELLELLQSEAAACRIDPRIVDWQAALELRQIRQLLLDSYGSETEQTVRHLVPELSVTAYDRGDCQTRSFGGFGRQGGTAMALQILAGAGRRTAREVLEILAAPICPSGAMDLLLMPGQMMLQIHESIGHPLELDRILGDERNYAGTSFVTLDMFGHYRYGSELLNVTFDPTLEQEYASYGWDDDGEAAEKVHLIEHGVLRRPIGGGLSQARAGIAGSASARACSWNRPSIDRMANLNLEPGNADLASLIGGIERGVMMDTNRSWSIDDSRNKFQFGCEQGWLIERGKIRGRVRNPGYRGISATFWRSLNAVGDRSTFEVLGTPFCGKGEPNQVIHVGHATPACRFSQVEVFGE